MRAQCKPLFSSHPEQAMRAAANTWGPSGHHGAVPHCCGDPGVRKEFSQEFHSQQFNLPYKQSLCVTHTIVPLS